MNNKYFKYFNENKDQQQDQNVNQNKHNIKELMDKIDKLISNHNGLAISTTIGVAGLYLYIYREATSLREDLAALEKAQKENEKAHKQNVRDIHTVHEDLVKIVTYLATVFPKRFKKPGSPPEKKSDMGQNFFDEYFDLKGDFDLTDTFLNFLSNFPEFLLKFSDLLSVGLDFLNQILAILQFFI